MTVRQRVVVVTGGGGGIGAAIAQSAAAKGAFVVTVDPMVSVDGSEQLPPTEQTTASRIVAAGGGARASAVSVTDESGIRELFEQLADEFGGLDAVVNVAGITRPTGFTHGSHQDWLSVLTVHLTGYLNVLRAALPLMAAAGRGHILGVTSGSGWRSADAGAYGCAKRAVASLTWQLGRHAPVGVVINALSPIAATRMVAAALGRPQRTTGAATGGLSLNSMPAPENLGPLGAHLIADDFTTCCGKVLFADGSEVAVIDEPRLLEVVRSAPVACPAHVFEAATTIALAHAEGHQQTAGGSNTRFGSLFDEAPAQSLPPSAARSCAIVADKVEIVAALSAALQARGVSSHHVGGPEQLAHLSAVDGVVVALSGTAEATGAASEWERILVEHEAVVEQIDTDATWTRAVAAFAKSANHPVRLVTITEATNAGGRTRAQASAQLARAGRSATSELILPFALSVEGSEFPADLAAHLVCSTEAASLTGAELVAGAAWFGVRSHPRPIGSIGFGGPAVPEWFDDALREVVRPL